MGKNLFRLNRIRHRNAHCRLHTPCNSVFSTSHTHCPFSVTSALSVAFLHFPLFSFSYFIVFFSLPCPRTARFLVCMVIFTLLGRRGVYAKRLIVCVDFNGNGMPPKEGGGSEGLRGSRGKKREGNLLLPDTRRAVTEKNGCS
ncbi:hypothetical protein NPIL_5511 [Nephila pilipes]|uniref:Transmembrane protein n=1 Tax=Nephila pilipes TaxID=299642 RepID=A0A8X6QNE4_NEPPI|nr:hypothetical protein NPIL_5511 [Nephila pilipes]